MLDKWDQVIRKKRKGLRLPDVSYSTEGYYFVTICVENRKCILGEISKPIVGAQPAEPARLIPNSLGQVVESAWLDLPNHHNVTLNTFQIMPNHIHIIIEIAGFAGKTPTFQHVTADSLGCVIRSFKSTTTRSVRLYLQNPNFTLWQRNYFERIIRDDNELGRLRYYIEQNPNDWAEDDENPERRNRKLLLQKVS